MGERTGNAGRPVPTGEGGEEGEAREEVEQLLPRQHALAAGRHVRFFPGAAVVVWD